MEETNKTPKKSYDWLKQYQFQKGNPGGPGRKTGISLKQFAREFLMSLPDEEKATYLACMPEDLVWKMAEGNPETGVEHSGGVEFTIKVEHDHRALEAPSESKPDNPEQVQV